MSVAAHVMRWPCCRSLVGLNTPDAVAVIARDHVDVLIDLNGHTLRSGVPLFVHRPAPVQVSFLGYSLTTAVPEMDYFIGDAITTPTWMTPFYTEALVRTMWSCSTV